MRYQLTNHTADIGIRLKNKTLSGLFEDAAFALLDIICDTTKVKPAFGRTISVEAINDEELLNLFLSVLLQEFTVKNNLIKKTQVTEIRAVTSGRKLSAVISGQTYNPKCHTIKAEIKAVTFHNLSIKKTETGYTAEVVFDV
jgi:SHS2 domain-containing protein